MHIRHVAKFQILHVATFTLASLLLKIQVIGHLYNMYTSAVLSEMFQCGYFSH